MVSDSKSSVKLLAGQDNKNHSTLYRKLKVYDMDWIDLDCLSLFVREIDKLQEELVDSESALDSHRKVSGLPDSGGLCLPALKIL